MFDPITLSLIAMGAGAASKGIGALSSWGSQAQARSEEHTSELQSH